MPQIVLHAGTHKTGTTTIQDALRAVAAALRQRGVLFPEAGCPRGQSGQHMLAWSVRASKHHKLPSPPPPVWDQLLKEIASVRPRLTILSAEAFSGAQHSEVEEVRRRLDGFDVSVVLYVREPMAYLLSSYKQLVKFGKCSTSFTQFMKDHVEEINYGSIIAPWDGVFGKENVNVRSFEGARKKGLLDDFADCTGIGGGILPHDIFSNVSPSDEMIRIMRYLNLTEEYLKEKPLRASAQRSVIERMRRRLLRGGTLTRGLESASRLMGLSRLVSVHDEAWLRHAVTSFPNGHPRSLGRD